jgi:hypothetical protein
MIEQAPKFRIGGSIEAEHPEWQYMFCFMYGDWASASYLRNQFHHPGKP